MNFIDPTAQISGNIHLGQADYIGPFAIVVAPGSHCVRLSAQDNIQDNALISASSGDVLIGDRTTIAHGAQVLNSSLGHFVFIGFNAQVISSVVCDGAMVQHGAKVIGVTIPEGRIVPPGAIITRASQAKDLPTVQESNIKFKSEVVGVNVEFVEGYQRMSTELGPSCLRGVSPNPLTSWAHEYISPVLGVHAEIDFDSRVIGNVIIGDHSFIGNKVSIRGDEGSPITIGDQATIGAQVTFHALEGQMVQVGEGLTAKDCAILHGPLTVKDQVFIGREAVVFQSTIGSGVRIGDKALVIGVNLPDGAKIPDGALILNQEAADHYSAA
jgi:carbon dioxide concentrating mechanism protein CcmM